MGLVTKNTTQHSAPKGTSNHSNARPHLDTVFSGAPQFPHTAQGACYYHADVNVGALRESSAKTQESIGLVSRECMIRRRRLLLMARLPCLVHHRQWRLSLEKCDISIGRGNNWSFKTCACFVRWWAPLMPKPEKKKNLRDASTCAVLAV